jgi:UDP-GlcNAc:undecaprenyl-phosphate GlcNAc-1-phosphate transferase
MTLLIIFFLSMSLSLVATPILITKLVTMGIVDRPGARRINQVVIPRMGGIVLIMSLLVIIFSFYPELSYARGFIYGLLVIVLCGIVDDIIGLKWNYKFLLQGLSALVIMFSLNLQINYLTIFFITMPSYLGYGVLFLFILGLINSINLMDGLDGLVSGYSILIIVSLLFISLQYHDFFINLILVSTFGSLIGFLKYNANPARIFLGDTGSLFLGYIISYAVLFVSKQSISNGNLDLSFAIILLSVPLIDTVKVMAIRGLKKKNPFHPDQNHLHHILLGKNLHHKKVVFLIHFYSLAYIFDAFIYYEGFRLLTVFMWFFISVILIFSGRIILTINNSKVFLRLNGLINHFSLNFITKNRVAFIIMSFFPAVIILSYFLVQHSLLKNISLLIIFLTVIGFVFLVSLFNKKKNIFISTFYIYFNFVVFFLILLFNNSKNYLLVYDNQLVFYSSITFIIFILLFLISRKTMLKSSALFFNGFDLSIIILTISIFIIHNFLSINNLNFIIPALIYAIFFYFWYKILIDLFNKYSNELFYSSFLFPVAALVVSFI